MENYILEKQESFELIHIFECGQCFRWNKQDDGSYTGIIGKNVVNVKKENEQINFTGKTENNNLKEIIINYFDL